ncbi:MAG TPA: hypothetical protein VFD32_02635 [Dehalococcoidia bacterium]|nr:hypothetical protein [Dehalococcoidia bacterium]
MPPVHHHVYVADELRRLHEQPATPLQQARLRWLTERAAQRRARRQAIALWLGDRLVALGARLQTRANAHTPPEAPVRTSRDAGL